MSTILLKRQYITDEMGNPIGVILPLNEFALVKDILEQRVPSSTDESESDGELLRQIELAATDPLFLADLQETMTAFAHVDTEWWEADS
jgi:hypothetical protein